MPKRYSTQLIVGGLFVVLVGCLSEAQADIPPPPNRPTPAALSNIEKAKKGLNNVRIKDESKEITDRNLKTIDQMVKHIVYHANQPPFNGEEFPSTMTAPFGTFDRSPKGLYAELRNWTDIPKPKGKYTEGQLEYAEAFGSIAAKECLKIINEGVKPIERINGARMLAEVANLPYAGTIDSLLPLINDPKYVDQPALTYVALEGIRNVLSHTQPDDPSKNLIRDPKKQTEIFNALLKFQPPVKLSTKPTPEEELKYRVYRRLMFSAMSQFRDPVIRDAKTKEILARPGVVLAAIAIPDPTIPGFKPNIADRVEAIVGLLNMNIDPDENFDLRIYIINRFLIEFGMEYSQDTDQAKIESRGTIIPWKIASARISAGLTQLSNIADANNKLGAPLKARIKALAADAQSSMLGIIEDPAKKAVINDNTLRDKLKAGASSYELIKGDKASTLSFPE